VESSRQNTPVSSDSDLLYFRSSTVDLNHDRIRDLAVANLTSTSVGQLLYARPHWNDLLGEARADKVDYFTPRASDRASIDV
jgi:hypothetical protein